jgi:hypothetical protein
MFKKFTLAVLAPVLLLLASAPLHPAQARVHFGVTVGPPIYTYPYYPYGYAYPYSYPYYGYPYSYPYASPYYNYGWGWGGWYGHGWHDHHDHHHHH